MMATARVRPAKMKLPFWVENGFLYRAKRMSEDPDESPKVPDSPGTTSPPTSVANPDCDAHVGPTGPTDPVVAEKHVVSLPGRGTVLSSGTKGLFPLAFTVGLRGAGIKLNTSMPPFHIIRGAAPTSHAPPQDGPAIVTVDSPGTTICRPRNRLVSRLKGFSPFFATLILMGLTFLVAAILMGFFYSVD